MKFSSKDLQKEKILTACEDWLTAKEIAQRVGLGLTSVHCYLWELENYVLKDKRKKFALYKRNPEKLFTPKPIRTRKEIMRDAFTPDNTAPILPQGPLSFLKEPQRHKLPKADVTNSADAMHWGWSARKRTPHIGSGSYAHMQFAGD